jgi:hypothetical protein
VAERLSSSQDGLSSVELASYSSDMILAIITELLMGQSCSMLERNEIYAIYY